MLEKDKEILLGDILAYEGKYVEAARVYVKARLFQQCNAM